MLAGIGFTMSLFIGTLAFEPASYAAPVRLGVLAGSVFSGIAGFLVLRMLSSRPALEGV
jgi:NhaA family Na+:H+ antiporter